MSWLNSLFASAPAALASVPLEAEAPRYVSPTMQDLINAMNLGLETSEQEAVLRMLDRFGDEVLRIELTGGSERSRERIARKITRKVAASYFARVDELRAQGRV